MKDLEQYKGDLNQLLETGTNLRFAMQFECYPEQVKRATKEFFPNQIHIKPIPNQIERENPLLSPGPG